MKKVNEVKENNVKFGKPTFAESFQEFCTRHGVDTKKATPTALGTAHATWSDNLDAEYARWKVTPWPETANTIEMT